jgi:CBS domain-containing protein
MTLSAREVMVTDFDKIQTDAPIEEAIQKIMNGKLRETGHKTVSLMVVDEYQSLAGVITMFDILYHLRPDFLNYGINGEDFSWEGHIETFIKNLKQKRVDQIMSTNLLSASPDEHLMVILDRMIKNKYRRLPISEDNRLVGVVYLYDIYYHLFKEYR